MPCPKPNFEVRSSKLECFVPECLGGANLKVKWSSWGPLRASGSGTKEQMHQGVVSRAHIDIVADTPRGGHFTRLVLTFPPYPGSMTLKMVRDSGELTWG